tara:strand:- start:789 stop:1148 length:360 start_codon:yes stop_codon:yes gene_type:complete
MPTHYGEDRGAKGGKKMGSFRVPKKGQASKTRKGEEDFTTKKTSKDFDRGGKREKTAQGSKVQRRPFTDKMKADLKKHLDDLGYKGAHRNRHRLKMMTKMRQGHSIKKAHEAIMKSGDH